MKAINNKLSGTLTLNSYTEALSGSSADVAAALDGTFATGYSGTATLNDNHTLDELVAINNGTSGTITLNSNGVALTGSTANVKAALAGNVGSVYTGDITLNDADGVNITATDITTIEGDTTGTITVSNNINIKGTATEVAAAVADVNTFS